MDPLNELEAVPELFTALIRQSNVPDEFAEGDPEIVAILLEKLSETPEGSPVALADNVSVQLELNE